MHVPFVWQVLHHQIVFACLLKYVVDCQALILRTGQKLHFIALKEKLLLSAEVWQSKIVVSGTA